MGTTGVGREEGYISAGGSEVLPGDTGCSRLDLDVISAGGAFGRGNSPSRGGSSAKALGTALPSPSFAQGCSVGRGILSAMGTLGLSMWEGDFVASRGATRLGALGG